MPVAGYFVWVSYVLKIMARPQRNNIDYFPHDVNHGKKMFYIEKKYGNDGYAAWYKLLEELGKANYHYLDISEDHTVMFLASYCNVSEDILKEIITDLVKLGVFDSELYESKILYNPKFIESIQDAYLKRSNDVFTRSELVEHLKSLGVSIKGKSTRKPPKSGSGSPVKPQRKVKDIIEEYIKEEKIVLPFDSKNFLEAFIIWVEYRAEIKKKVHDGEISLQGQLRKIQTVSGGVESEAIRIINNCIDNKWVGIQDHKPKNNETGQITAASLADTYERLKRGDI